jgi:hypothetical protein
MHTRRDAINTKTAKEIEREREDSHKRNIAERMKRSYQQSLSTEEVNDRDFVRIA